MTGKGIVKGIMNPIREGRRSVKVATLSAAFSVASLALGTWSCNSKGDDDSMRDCVVAQPPVALEDSEGDDIFVADNDIAMTVRSVADAINVGEPIDSLDYSFKGILTDGTGMPLFTDIEGLPGEWEVEVISPSVVQIRNVNSGDLISEDLVGYISAALQLGDADVLQLISERETSSGKVTVFSFGKGTLTVETSPNDSRDLEAGDRILITMRADRRDKEMEQDKDTIEPSSSQVEAEVKTNVVTKVGAQTFQN